MEESQGSDGVTQATPTLSLALAASSLQILTNTLVLESRLRELVLAVPVDDAAVVMTVMQGLGSHKRLSKVERAKTTQDGEELPRQREEEGSEIQTGGHGHLG